MKKEAAQDNLNHAKLGDEELSNTLPFKYLGVMQAADGDLLAPVFHCVEIVWSRFRNLRYILTASKVPKSLRLRLFQASVISTLLYGCESWKMTEKVKRKT